MPEINADERFPLSEKRDLPPIIPPVPTLPELSKSEEAQIRALLTKNIELNLHEDAEENYLAELKEFAKKDHVAEIMLQFVMEKSPRLLSNKDLVATALRSSSDVIQNKICKYFNQCLSVTLMRSLTDEELRICDVLLKAIDLTNPLVERIPFRILDIGKRLPDFLTSTAVDVISDFEIKDDDLKTLAQVLLSSKIDAKRDNKDWTRFGIAKILADNIKADSLLVKDLEDFLGHREIAAGIYADLEQYDGKTLGTVRAFLSACSYMWVPAKRQQISNVKVAVAIALSRIPEYEVRVIEVLKTEAGLQGDKTGIYANKPKKCSSLYRSLAKEKLEDLYHIEFELPDPPSPDSSGVYSTTL